MHVVSTREFRAKQRMYLDMIDKNEQVILQRGKNRAYALTPITEADRYFSDPDIQKRLMLSIQQAENGNVITLPKEDISKFLGL